MIRRIKATLLVTVLASGGTMFSCGIDLRQSAAAGVQTFVVGYVNGVLDAVVPPPGSLLGDGS